MERRLRIALGTAVGLAVLHAVYLATHLPPRVASHFGADGQPNGWMTKVSLAVFYVALVVVLTAALAGTADSLERRRKLKLPHAEEWLSPGQRAAAFAWLRSWFYGFALLNVLLLMAVMQAVAIADSRVPPVIDLEIGAVTAGYLGGCSALVALLWWHFGRARH